MTFKRPRARILERSITAGNGPYALAGAVDGSYNNFASFMAVGDVTEGYVIEPGVAFWTGILTYSAANQITLTTVEETSGTFGSGTKEIGAGAMASKSAFPQDIAGAIVTGGTSTAYTVGSYRVYDSLVRLDGNIIAFTPHATNGAVVTLNVDGLGNKPLRPSPGVELQSNVLIQGTPYLALYNNSDGVFYLHAAGGTYGVPLFAGMDFWDTVTPGSAFIFPAGQALSRTAYAAAFARWGTRYGSGDGSTTFNAPDKTGRVSAMLEATPTRILSALNSNVMGGNGGAETHTLTNTEMPVHNHGTTESAHSHGIHSTNFVAPNAPSSGGVANVPASISGTAFFSGSGSFLAGATDTASTGLTVNNAGSGSAHNIMQPTIICNYIIRVL